VGEKVAAERETVARACGREPDRRTVVFCSPAGRKPVCTVVLFSFAKNELKPNNKLEPNPPPFSPPHVAWLPIVVITLASGPLFLPPNSQPNLLINLMGP